MEATKVMNEVQSIETGLSLKDVNERQKIYGLNTLKESKKINPIILFLKQFSDILNIILIISTIVSVVLGEVVESVTIIVIVITNALLSFIQEFKTEKTLAALKKLSTPSAKVIREKNLQEIDSTQIVPGDLIVLEPGDRIPADGYVVLGRGMKVDESILSGESMPVTKKTIERRNIKSDKFNEENSVYMGTLVTSGKGRFIVTKTGMQTEMGQIASMLKDIEQNITPLQKKLDQLGKYIAYACLSICSIVVGLGIIRGEDVFTMFLAGISLAVASIPEGLPAVVTITLALGIQRMLKRNALIRKLPAVETLGSASVICSDKTGTLTENRLTVCKIYTQDGIKDFSDISEKNIVETQLKALEIGCICNNSRRAISNDKQQNNSFLRKKSKSKKEIIIGDSLENALLLASEKVGLNKENLDKKLSRCDEIEFDSDRKMMSVICKNSKLEKFVFNKGAVETILNKCTHIYTKNGVYPLDKTMKSKVLSANGIMANEALRVIALSYKDILSNDNNKNGDISSKYEDKLVFVGLIGMIDPPRKEVFEAVSKCKLMGIKPVMITGDQKLTAVSIASKLGIYLKDDKVLTGDELNKMSEQELTDTIDEVSVFARVLPKHKLDIIKAFKNKGHIVAMTGDGVNDAPAVKNADIGISMGISGTDVTKEASSMILLDDNFSTIVSAIVEGRTIFGNIRKFIRYMISCNIGEVITMFIAMLLGLPLPLLPIQILWVNLITDGLPAVALSMEPSEGNFGDSIKKRNSDNILKDGLMKVILFRGIQIGFSTLCVFLVALSLDLGIDKSRTMALATLIITQLIHVFECKSENKNIFQIPFLNNKYLIYAWLISAGLLLSVVYVPILQGVFKTQYLNTNEWGIILGFSLFGPLLGLFKTNKNKVKR